MRIYFSGGRGLNVTPESLIPERKPCIMLTYHDIESNGTIDRLNVFLARKQCPLLPRTGKKAVREEDGKVHYTKSMFMDSGAYSLYNLHVRKSGAPRVGEHGKELERVKVRLDKADFSYFSLKKGSEFRKYCDAYARFMSFYKDSGMLFTNVDVISNPVLTFETQSYFEKEHGLFPVPVVHATGKTPLCWAERYVESGKHKLLGVGGLGQNVGINDYVVWASKLYHMLCPASNNYYPVIRTHGFAMTSWFLIRAFPWWSVDSATWVKLSAYGWLYVPRWSAKKKAWDFDHPPFQINVSQDSSQASKGRHYYSLARRGKGTVLVEHIEKWLGELGLDLGQVTCTKREEAIGLNFTDRAKLDKEHKEMTLSGHFVMRNKANLHYLKSLEESRPKWPNQFQAIRPMTKTLGI